MNKPIIEVNALRKVFHIPQKSRGFFANLRSFFHPTYKEVTAVQDISFSVEPGEIVAFIGPNGAGKSTTIKMLSGILVPTSGSIRILDYIPAVDRKKLAFHIGTVFGQKGQLWYHLPPLETYTLFARIYEMDKKQFQKRLQFLVETFEIEHLLKVPVRKLSLGQRMRCEIVGSLIHQPSILFLDEPTIGLDIIAKQQVRDAIKYLNEEDKVTIFLTSHDTGDIETLTKRTIVINYGSIILDELTETMKKKYITTKVVVLVVKGTTDRFFFEGGSITEKTKHTLKVELDLSVTSIEKLLTYALENFVIIDINIFDQPLEQVIAAIYREPKP